MKKSRHVIRGKQLVRMFGSASKFFKTALTLRVAVIVLISATLIYLVIIQCNEFIRQYNKKPEITEDKIYHDIIGNTVSDYILKFTEEQLIQVFIVRADYSNDRANLVALVKTRRKKKWEDHKCTWISGDLRLKYEWYNNEWKLMKIENVSLKEFEDNC